LRTPSGLKNFETHFKFTTNSENFTTHFEIFATHFEIFTTHFEIFATHSPQDPKCWQRKRNGYAAPPSSFHAMFCSTCGQQLQESFVFCPKCGLELAANVTQGSCDVDSQKNIIETYFLAGFEYDTIITFLERVHDIHISLSTLKRRLRDYGLKRRNSADLNQNEVRNIIREELDGPSCMSGYRAMWHTLLLKYGLCIPRSTVQSLLKELDPVGTEERRKHRLKRRTYFSSGPNECWHVDGYDKLKPFGFPIHGAVDGYSRRVLWSKVTPSNNNPSIVGNFFLDCVSEFQGCPKLLRTDPGTENILMATMQCLLRANGNDEFSGEKAHRYGPSTGNQRVECWWSHLKKSRTTWWINFFKDLVDRGVFLPGNIYHNECIWFCFNELLQRDLDFVVLHWNTLYPTIQT